MRKPRRAKALVYCVTFVLVSALLPPLFGSSANAQATTGSIRGVVLDQSGAVVAGATISAKNEATGVTTATLKSTGDGIYNLPNLIPGKYTVTAEAPNFKKAVFTSVDVRVGQDTTLDVALQAGIATETVTVMAGTEEVINKESAQISSSFDARKVNELPSNVAGAGIDTLALLAPGVLPGFGNVNSNGTTLSVNGQRARSNNFTIDGQDNNDLSIGGPNYFVSNQDLVQDFQVITNNFSAQYGRNQGAIINIATKSGTNSFHGSASEYHIDRKLFGTQNNLERRGRNAADPASLEAPPLLYNVFGGTLGGPIIKDKAFFFGSFQGIRTAETFIARSGSVALLPEEFARFKADFAGNPLAQAVADFGAFALNDFGTVRPRTDTNPFDTITLGGHTYKVAQPERSFKVAATAPVDRQNEYTGRGDVKISDKDGVWGRYLYQNGVTINGLGGSNGFTGDIPFRSQNAGGNWTRQVSNRALNEFGAAYSRLFVKFGGGCDGLKGCIPDPSNIGEAFTNITFTALSARGFSLQTIGPATNLPQGRTVEAFQFHDNFSLTRGRHQMIAGADIRRLRNSVPFLPNINGAFSVGNATRLVNNAPQQVTVAAGTSTLAYTETDRFFFFQDDFKIRDNFTLNLGLRYEYIGQPINLLHNLTVKRESDPTTALFKTSLSVEDRSVPKIPADKNNWAPRLGFAWTPRFGKGGWMGKVLGEDATVVRGGYSIAYDPPFYNILLNISTAAPVVFNSVTLNSATPGAGLLFPFPPGGGTGPTVRAFAESRGLIVKGVLDPRFQNQTPVANNFHLPYIQQWSFGIQRQINSANVFEVRYVGNKATGLFQTNNRNPRVDRILSGFTFGGLTFPGLPDQVPAGVTGLAVGQGGCVDDPATPFVNESAACVGRVLPRGRIQERGNTASSTYNALQTRYNGRLHNQLTYGASYTFSKALDNSSEIFAFNTNSALTQNPFDINRSEKSFSGFDRRHGGSINVIWDLPWFKDGKGVIGHTLGGWQLNATHVLASGRRYSVSEAFSATFFNSGIGYVDPISSPLRPFYGNPTADAKNVGVYQRDAFLFNALFGLGLTVPTNNPSQVYSLNALLNDGVLTQTSANDVRFIYNGAGAAALKGTPYGDVPRMSEKGPKLNQLNLGIFKNTRITERVKLQFRMEMFNALNHPNPGYGLVGSEAGDSPDFFIEDAGSTFANNTEIQFARRLIQFGLRLTF